MTGDFFVSFSVIEGLISSIPALPRGSLQKHAKQKDTQVNLVSFLLYIFLRKVRDSNPRYDVMRTPHFECGSFDHSDNFPLNTVQK